MIEEKLARKEGNLFHSSNRLGKRPAETGTENRSTSTWEGEKVGRFREGENILLVFRFLVKKAGGRTELTNEKRGDVREGRIPEKKTRKKLMGVSRLAP